MNATDMVESFNLAVATWRCRAYKGPSSSTAFGPQPREEASNAFFVYLLPLNQSSFICCQSISLWGKASPFIEKRKAYDVASSYLQMFAVIALSRFPPISIGRITRATRHRGSIVRGNILVSRIFHKKSSSDDYLANSHWLTIGSLAIPSRDVSTWMHQRWGP